MEDLLARILIIDDDLLSISLVSGILRKASYGTEHATSGEAAMNLLNEKTFDLILLDIEMPEMNGFEVSRWLRSVDNLKEIPVLFLTGHTDLGSIVKAFEAGANDYISKPFNYKELLVRVETHIKLKRQTDEIKEINRILENSNRDLLESISYTKYLQESIFPSVEHIGKSVPENFVFYQPKDIVSGDFFWYRRIKNLFYIAAADCTGHGVPGAFMSVMGISALNHLVNSRRVDKPGKVLSKLRNNIMRMLNQSEAHAENSNGLDISLCCIDLETNTLEYAGANLPLYLITRNETTLEPELVIKKPNHMPIGLHPNDKNEFTNHTIELKRGDRFYIFSDGYISQFGGIEDKKFGSKNFRQLLYNIHARPMPDQKREIEKAINQWRGSMEQVDDILVLGFKY
jgi:CheY-like chemotaxis protein